MSKKKPSGLGKGLDSLIPDYYNEDFDSNETPSLEELLNEKDDEVTIPDETEEETVEAEEEIEEETPEEPEEEETISGETEEVEEEEELEEPPEEPEAETVEEIEEEVEELEEEETEDETEVEIPEEDDEIIEEEDENNTLEEPPEEEIEEEVQLTEKEIANIDEVKEIVEKNPRITLWSAQSAAVFRYLRKTEPEFSISKEASILIDDAVRDKYPEIWKLFD